MTKNERILGGSLSEGYSVFERDQVLSHDQLNSVAGYLDQETRLNRTTLSGVGIICGLRVSIQGNTVALTRGAGVTTDGDLILIPHDMVYDRYKRYDDSNPRYEPLYVDNELLTIYELVEKDTKDERGTGIDVFKVKESATLDTMVGVLLVESYTKDDDLCSATACDNLGQKRIYHPKLLVMDRTLIGPLQANIATPAQAAGTLGELLAPRTLIVTTVVTTGDLARVYRETCFNMQNMLVLELPKVYPACSFFLSDVFTADPAPEWLKKLSDIRNKFAPNNDFGLQYYFAFLKDVFDTYNRFRESLFDERTLCVPAFDSFAKHLLAGNLSGQPNPEENRTPFYPSPVVSPTSTELQHGKFLIQKLDMLIRSFQVPAAGAAIRITSSHTEERSLEERAVPYYYQARTQPSVYATWNYRLHHRGMDLWNYGYYGADIGARGGASDPLHFQIGGYPFFRIEGHLGRNIQDALASIQKLIADHSLPFDVHPVLLGADRTKVVRPWNRYTDLHRLHYMLRQDLSQQLDEARDFSAGFAARVPEVAAAEKNKDLFITTAKEKNSTIAAKATSARNALVKDYAGYQADPSWRAAVTDTITAASDFRATLGDVAKTEFATPFDSLLSTTQVRWIDWLDQIIKNRDQQEDEKLLLSNFIKNHPGAEHTGGVARGGTFILAYDVNNTVVADFTVPYCCCDAKADDPIEPPLKDPGLRPPTIWQKGIRVLPSVETFVSGKITANASQLQDSFSKQIEAQKQNYVLAFKDTMNVVAPAIGTLAGKQRSVAGGVVGDAFLNTMLEDAAAKRQALDDLNTKAADTTLDLATREQARSKAAATSVDLAKSLTDTTKYVSDAGIDVTAGSDGNAAIAAVADHMKAISSPDAVTTVKAGLKEVSTTTKNTKLQTMLGSLLRR